MNKRELIKNVSEKLGATQTATSVVVDAVFEEMTAALANHEEVSIGGFGKFVTVHQEAKECRNPQTGEPVMVDAKYAPRFKASLALKEAVK